MAMGVSPICKGGTKKKLADKQQSDVCISKILEGQRGWAYFKVRGASEVGHFKKKIRHLQRANKRKKGKIAFGGIATCWYTVPLHSL